MIDSTVYARLGWTLTHFLWQGTLVAVVAWIVSLPWREARVRYAIGCTALLLMAALPPVTFALLGGGEAVPAVSHSLRDLLSRPLPLSSGGAPMDDTAVPMWLVWVVWAWAFGVVVFSARLAGGWLLTRRLVQRCQPASPVWQQMAARAAERLGFRAALRILASARVDVPMVVGHIRPLIVVPAAALVNLPADQLEAILAHEIAHILRRDPLVNLLQTLAETILFYHPAVWWLSSRIRAERENCCDDIAVAACGRRRLYAEALLALEQGREAEPAFALSSRGGGLRRRIARLWPAPQPSPRPVFPALVALLSVVAIAGIAARTGSAQKAPQPAPVLAKPNPEAHPAPVLAQARGNSGVQPVLASPYQKWVEEDVVYIIRPEELKAFRALKDDAEREHFIEQFWARRNPNPGAAENTFKEEHYRRIAYANNRFASDLPGWKTERGRLYIVLGPPDEIETHPTDGYEQWMYHSVAGLGNNVSFEFDLYHGAPGRVETLKARAAALQKDIDAGKARGDWGEVLKLEPQLRMVLRLFDLNGQPRP